MWWHRGRVRGKCRSPEPGLTGETDVVKECEAFLAGRLAEEWIRDHHQVPDWAWLNVIAHGSHAKLAALRHEEMGGLVTIEEAWRHALVILADAAVGAADASACSLEEIQSEVLVPLELELSTRPLKPGKLVDLVIGALNHYRAI